MLEIKITSHWDSGKILICGEYKSIKDCLQKNRGADLRGADLRGAYLGGACLGDADLRDTDLGDADLGGADLGGAYLGGAYLGGAYLGDADLGGADLRDADLGGAYLRGADLRGAKNYSMSHDFALEIIRRQDIKLFSDKEWMIIGQIAIHRICWDRITSNYKPAISIFEKLDKLGYPEFMKKLKGEMK